MRGDMQDEGTAHAFKTDQPNITEEFEKVKKGKKE